MPSRHQITMDVLAGADQVPGHFLFHARDSDRDDLPRGAATERGTDKHVG